MLTSKSGKVQYLCPKCRSPEVAGPIHILSNEAIACTPCNAWYQWPSRIKVSIQRVAVNRGADRG